MSTSTVVVRSMATCLTAVLCLAAVAAAQQSITPTNATLSSQMAASVSNLTIQTGDDNGQAFPIAPLTKNVGLGEGPTAIAAIGGFTGTLKLVDPTNLSNVTASDIAYISCDPNSETSNIGPTTVARDAAMANPTAMILFSLSAASCNISDYIYTTLYTMTSVEDSRSLAAVITSSQPQAQIGRNGSTSSGSGGNSQTNNEGGPAPTTAVAMSILYSITGIITLLFLIIIATGAIRAHRHPERYGPRNGFPGRPRQSRAKGLARAMLETLPIVKFGDPEPAKPGSQDVELENGSTRSAPVHQTQETGVTPMATTADRSQNTSEAKSETAPVESGLNPATKAESTHSAEAAVVVKESELGCSICTEDFTTGEDVRVLPCNHKYHPACIDPWLLNVSGTCPLCRHDLRPANDPSSPITEEGDELPPPLAVNEGGSETGDTSEPHRGRASRFLDLHRLRHAPPEQRIAALRSLREESQREVDGTEGSVDESSRRTRLTGRLRDTFRIRTRTQAVPE